MSGVRGLALGVLGLTLLDAAIGTSKAASNVGGITKVISGGLARIIDPSVALIPDKRSAVQGQGGQPIILAN